MRVYNATALKNNLSSASQYEELLTDIWVGVLLSTALLSCVCCMCSCLLYHKFQKWKRLVLHDEENPEIMRNINPNFDCESLPSYTIASGLPSYEEALKQLETAKIKYDVRACVRPLPSSPSRVSLMTCIHNVVNEKNCDR